MPQVSIARLKEFGITPSRDLGQNFLIDDNVLKLAGRLLPPRPGEVVLEVGPGLGVLTRWLAARVRLVHAIEIDERLRPALAVSLEGLDNVDLRFADVMRTDLRALDPPPAALYANLPYAVATPVIVTALPVVERFCVMVQREIADRLRASSGSRTYGAPSALLQLACEIELLRTVDRAVFRPRPHVDSALLRLKRRSAAAPPALARFVRDAFAHRRKPIAGSLELTGGPSREAVRGALSALGLDGDVRAEALAPADFVHLAERLGVH